MRWSLKNTTLVIFLVLFQTVSYGAGSSDQLADQLINELQIDNSITLAIDNSLELFKNVPQNTDKEIQKKIDALYTQAKTQAQAKKSQQQAEIKAKVKEKIIQNFNEAELRYLVQLARYSVYKKLKTFMESESYNMILAGPFIEKKAVLNKLKTQAQEFQVKAGSNGNKTK